MWSGEINEMTKSELRTELRSLRLHFLSLHEVCKRLEDENEILLESVIDLSSKLEDAEQTSWEKSENA
jgi:hypothetical protein